MPDLATLEADSSCPRFDWGEGSTANNHGTSIQGYSKDFRLASQVISTVLQHKWNAGTARALTCNTAIVGALQAENVERRNEEVHLAELTATARNDEEVIAKLHKVNALHS